MADQGNYYFNGNMGTAADQQAAAQNQQQQSQRTAEMLAATSGVMHSNFESLVGTTGADVITDQRFNTIIGIMLLYGFAVNAILCFVFGDTINDMAMENAIIYFAIYIVGMIVGTIICHKAKTAVAGFIGYNLIVVPMGIFITPLLSMYQITTIQYAFCVMGICMLLMVGLAQLYPQFFRSIGRMLLSCLFIGIIGEVVMWCLGFSSGIFDFVFIGIFLGYIGYDWAVAQSSQKTTTNAIRASYMIYVDLINLLIRLLRIIAKNRD